MIGGSKTWVLRYEHQKRERWMGLGSVEFVTLAQAREQSVRASAQVEGRGIDPLERRRAAVVGARIAALKRGTFEEVARQYVEMKSRAMEAATALAASGCARLSATPSR